MRHTIFAKGFNWEPPKNISELKQSEGGRAGNTINLTIKLSNKPNQQAVNE